MNWRAFDYTIEPRRTWPPRRHPVPPFSPSAIEVMHSCPLRSLFEASPGYARRLGFAARVGTALHLVLRSLNERPPLGGSTSEVAEETRRRFEHEIHAQMVLADSRPRERGLTRDESRIDRAAEAAVVEALRIVPVGATGGDAVRPDSQPRMMDSGFTNVRGRSDEAPATEVEVPLASSDGLFHGRVDRAERRSDGTWLFDYKSALRDDLPERYERQLQLYAYMWHDVRREWPAHAQVLYALTASLHPVCVEPALCRQVVAQSAELISRMQQASSAEQLATPGAVCGVCDFRPWCEPFWRWQASEQALTAALEKAVMGFTGRVEQLDIVDHYWQVEISWRSAKVLLRAPEERLPQLAKAHIGVYLRVFDTRLRGLRHQPQALITPLSEVFVMT